MHQQHTSSSFSPFLIQFNFSIPSENFSRINLVCHIVKAAVIAVSNNGIAHTLEFGKAIDNLTAVIPCFALLCRAKSTDMDRPAQPDLRALFISPHYFLFNTFFINCDVDTVMFFTSA